MLVSVVIHVIQCHVAVLAHKVDTCGQAQTSHVWKHDIVVQRSMVRWVRVNHPDAGDGERSCEYPRVD